MMNLNTFNAGAVRLFVGGQQIGEMQSLSYEPKEEPTPIGTPLTTKGIVTLSDVQFDYTLTEMFNPAFDIKVRNFKFMPPRKLRSKKKRIIRKWEKLYSYDVESTVYKNCTITGVSEHGMA